MIDKKMMSSRDAFQFTLLYAEVLSAIEARIRAHEPAAEFLYFDCGDCKELHLLVFLGEKLLFSANVPEGAWTPVPTRH